MTGEGRGGADNAMSPCQAMQIFCINYKCQKGKAGEEEGSRLAGGRPSQEEDHTRRERRGLYQELLYQGCGQPSNIESINAVNFMPSADTRARDVDEGEGAGEGGGVAIGNPTTYAC